MKLDRKQRQIINKLAKKYNVTPEQVMEIVELPFAYIRQEIKTISLNGDESREEFEEKTKNFNIPCIGKLHANYFNFKKINNGKKADRERGPELSEPESS